MELIAKGGIIVIPLLVCSIVTCAIFCERVIRYVAFMKRGKDLENKITGHVRAQNDRAAMDLAAKSNCPIGRILGQAMEVGDGDRDTLETVMVHATEKEVRYLSRYLQMLATVGNIAPLLGLLGTVLGMIKAFMVIEQNSGKVDASVLAGGIWEAMLTTALGLAVALPTMLAYNCLTAWVERYKVRLESGCVSYLKALTERRATT
jgi:biopolymer transport protein ExbB